MEYPTLKDRIVHTILPRVQTPGQYIGGELNSVVKDHRRVSGTVCLAFPDTYAIGMSHHGLQVLYALMNRRDGWACERVFTPLADMERLLREHELPLVSLETYTPLGEFDVVGFSLQYELGASNVLTMLDLGRIPLRAADRSLSDPLVIAGGPCAQNPEPMARFIDLFVVGDGEESLPTVCDRWLEARAACGNREEALAQLASLPYVYVPRLHEPVYRDGAFVGMQPLRPDVPPLIRPAVLADLDGTPLPTAPVVPFVESVQDRIAIEIMRGCPWRCRFCQATTIKRPLRYRHVETIVQAALESYAKTGYNEISLLSLSTSDYPLFDELMVRMREVFRPMDVAISIPSLRVNEQLQAVGALLTTERRSGMTIAPEAARDDMRGQIGKPIKNDDLFNGCRAAFEQGFQRVKLYFMCGLPGERESDLEGILEMAEIISRIGHEARGRWPRVVASVSNFVPKPHTPYQFRAMQSREYFQWAHDFLRRRRKFRNIDLKLHDVESSLLEGILSRGDRRTGAAIEEAWRKGARLDGWREHARYDLWHAAFEATGVGMDETVHREYAAEEILPWDHIAIRQGRYYLTREHGRSITQLAGMGS